MKVKLAKFLMNLFPNRPKYQEDHFISEIFKHPKYLSFSEEEKEMFRERMVRKNIKEAEKKPFDLFYPNISFKTLLSGKRVLDLGCGIGGKTIWMGENWGVKEFYGIDVNEESIEVANNYINNYYKGNIKFNFVQGYGENMPFEDNFFDAIVSHDTIEHVRSVKETLKECKRILKEGGVAYLVFPSFKLPLGGAHISSVTKTPMLEWFFSPTTINKAYLEIVSEWGDDMSWYLPKKETEEGWAVVRGGIGVNGTLYKDFMKIIDEVGFKEVNYVKIPLLSVSNTAMKYPFLGMLTITLKPLLSIDFFKDYLSQRLVFILKK